MVVRGHAPSLRCDQWNHPTVEAPIDLEVPPVEGEDAAVALQLRHAHQAGIRQLHPLIVVFEVTPVCQNCNTHGGGLPPQGDLWRRLTPHSALSMFVAQRVKAGGGLVSIVSTDTCTNARSMLTHARIPGRILRPTPFRAAEIPFPADRREPRQAGRGKSERWFVPGAQVAKEKGCILHSAFLPSAPARPVASAPQTPPASPLRSFQNDDAQRSSGGPCRPG